MTTNLFAESRFKGMSFMCYTRLASTCCMKHGDFQFYSEFSDIHHITMFKSNAQDNMLDESSAIMLEYGLQTHPSIEAWLRLDTSFERLRSGHYPARSGAESHWVLVEWISSGNSTHVFFQLANCSTKLPRVNLDKPCWATAGFRS